MKTIKTMQYLLNKMPNLIIDAVWEATDGGYKLTEHQLVESNNAYIDFEEELTSLITTIIKEAMPEEVDEPGENGNYHGCGQHK